MKKMMEKMINIGQKKILICFQNLNGKKGKQYFIKKIHKIV